MQLGTSAIRRRRRRPRVPRAGVIAAAVTSAIVQAAACGAWSVRPSPAPVSGYIFWTNRKYLYWTNWGKDAIGRARLNGTSVRQSILTIPGGSPNGVAVDARR